eukprot:scaffold5676_cov146-Isochrysis_galbana.AAC.1
MHAKPRRAVHCTLFGYHTTAQHRGLAAPVPHTACRYRLPPCAPLTPWALYAHAMHGVGA